LAILFPVVVEVIQGLLQVVQELAVKAILNQEEEAVAAIQC
jgi:hypothetical protein